MSMTTRAEDTITETPRTTGRPRSPRNRHRLAPLLTFGLLLGACTAVPPEDATAASPTGSSSSDMSSSGSAPSGSSSASGSAPTEEPVGNVEVLASGLAAPWSIAFHDDTALVSERDSGRILELGPTGALREVGTVPDVAARGEGGLLGIAVQEGWLYAYYTAADENRIARFELTGEAGSPRLGPQEMVLDDIPAATTHNGGRIAFGPDGLLYATTGDTNDRASAQDLESLAGKILRLNPDGSTPVDNPFDDSPVYSYGHRNPQGIAWDEAGVMYSTEFGQDTWDELNIIEAGGNYGWPKVEGVATTEGFLDPVQQWTPGEASPSGMAITEESIFVANLRGERLREIPLEDLEDSTIRAIGDQGRLRDVVVAPDGSLWVLTNNTDGRGDPTTDDNRILRISLQ